MLSSTSYRTFMGAGIAGLCCVLGLGVISTFVGAKRAQAADVSLLNSTRLDEQHNGSIDVDSGLGNNLANDGEIICNLMLEGPITAGDLDRVKGAVQTFRAKAGIAATPRICLHSPGGSYHEGLAIASYMIEEGVGSAVPDGGECYSACSLIFMGGSYPWKGQLNRFLHVGGVVGFHAPFVSGLPDEQYGNQQMAAAFSEGVRAIEALMRLGVGDEVQRFPPELLHEMLKNGPDQLYNIDTVGKAIRYRVHLYGFERAEAVTEESLCNACVNMHYGASEIYGRGGESDLCASPGELMRQAFPKGERLIFEVAPRGGVCTIDVELRDRKASAWTFNKYGEEEWGSGLELAHWFLLPPNTQLATLAGRPSPPALREGGHEAAPVAPQRPEQPPLSPSTSEGDLADAVVRFAAYDYLGHDRPDHETPETVYGARVSYYDRGLLSRAEVMAEKQAYYRKWPRRSYRMIEKSLVARDSRDGSLDLTFRYSFEVSDGRRSAAGIGVTTIGVQLENGQLIVVRETGRVIERY